MRRIIAAAVGISMLLGTTVFADSITLSLGDNISQTVIQQEQQTAIFSDTQTSDWYYPHMKMLVEKGGINGYKDHTFRPNNQITNAEFIKTITIDIERNDGQAVISFTNGFTMIEEQKIPKDGSFTKEIRIPSTDKINFIHIKIGVTAVDNKVSNSKSVYYNILSNKTDTISCIETDGENKTMSYDFSKLFQW